MNTKHIIWSNMNLNVDDWRDSYKEFLEANEMDGEPDNDNEVYEYMVETNVEYLNDERANLAHLHTDGDIIIIADLGLWNGRRCGYRIEDSHDISDLLYGNRDTIYSEWYVDGLGDLRGVDVHHDGRNDYLYRELRPELSEEQIENFTDKLYQGTCTRKDITRYTRRIGNKIADVYGWTVRK